jgi:hypothetical protein
MMSEDFRDRKSMDPDAGKTKSAHHRSMKLSVDHLELTVADKEYCSEIGNHPQMSVALTRLTSLESALIKVKHPCNLHGEEFRIRTKIVTYKVPRVARNSMKTTMGTKHYFYYALVQIAMPTILE